MSFQEITVEIPHLSVEQQLRLLEMLTASLRTHWAATPTVQLEDATARFDDSPLADLVGMGQSGLSDVASRHDDYLYGSDGLSNPQ